MKEFILQYVGRLFRDLALLVPCSFGIACAVLFVVLVLFDANPETWTTRAAWKWSYVIIAVLLFMMESVFVWGAIGHAKSLARRYRASFDDVAEALVRYKLIRVAGYQEMTPEGFWKWLEDQRSKRSPKAAAARAYRKAMHRGLD